MINRKQRSYKANHIAFKSAKPASKAKPAAAKPAAAKGKKWDLQMNAKLVVSQDETKLWTGWLFHNMRAYLQTPLSTDGLCKYCVAFRSYYYSF